VKREELSFQEHHTHNPREYYDANVEQNESVPEESAKEDMADLPRNIWNTDG